MLKRVWGFGLTLALLTCFSPTASATSLVYGGLIAGQSSAPGTNNVDNLGLLVGVDIPVVPFLSVEASDHDINSWNIRTFNISAVGRFPIAPGVHLIAKAGNAHLSHTTNGAGTEDDLFYGVGASFALPTEVPLSLRGEYSVIEATGGNIDTLQADLILHF